jgi:hypothetical protein
VDGNGNPTEAHVYRLQDTTANNILWTPQDGLNDWNDPERKYLNLPNVPVYGIVRDPDDPVNTWFVATEIGVFTTTDKGSTWFDATSPLGLPPVECTAIRLMDLPGNLRYLNVATNGRGLWRFDLKDAVEQKLPPALTTSFTLSRSGDKVFAVYKFTNSTATGVGPAENVVVTASSIKASATTVATTTPLTISLGAIGKGQSKYVTLEYPATAGTPPVIVLKSGSAADLSVSYTFAGNPAGTIDKVRTRLP